MKCPYCGSENSVVVDSRPSPDNSIRRRRHCKKCGERYTTIEQLYKSLDGNLVRPRKMVVLATGSDQKYEFVLLVRNKKKEEKK